MSSYIEFQEHHYSINKAVLSDVFQKYIQRNDHEEIDYLVSSGGMEYLEKELNTDFRTGIRQNEVQDRAAQFGSNAPPKQEEQSFMGLLCDALNDFTLKLLIIAAVVSIIANLIIEKENRSIAWIDGAAILFAVALCSGIQALNDFQKHKQFAALSAVAYGQKNVLAIRDSEVRVVHSSEIVVGDILKIQDGMEVPGDMILIEGHEVACDESNITGESNSLKKKPLQECLELIKESQKLESATNGKQEQDISLNHRTLSAEAMKKMPSPVIISGTKILNGEGRALVLNVGMSSIVGQVQRKLVSSESSSEVTPLQGKLETIARDIAKLGLGGAILTFVGLLGRLIIDCLMEGGFQDANIILKILEYLIISLTVIVVAIPEGLPLAVTISLAFSVKKMLRDNNLVRRLHAAETMGGANNICCDKTGTLTENRLRVKVIWNFRSIDLDDSGDDLETDSEIFNETFGNNGVQLMNEAFACNNSANLEPESGTGVDKALLRFLKERSTDIEELREKHLTGQFTRFPFSSKRKMMSTVLENVSNVDNSDEVEQTSQRRMHIKGAAEIILEGCSKIYSFQQHKAVELTEDIKLKIKNELNDLAEQALRVIAVGYKNLKGNENFQTYDDKGIFEIEKEGFTLLALIGIRDRIRPCVKQAINKCRKAGIKVRMVTGDNLVTARAIARECGILDETNPNSLIMEGPEFMEQIGGIVEANNNSILESHDDSQNTFRLNNNGHVEDSGAPKKSDTIGNPAAFSRIYKELDVLARCRPEDKYALVLGLIQKGAVVAVTGDGSNDAMSLKKADVGFVMNSGTEVAKEAGDIILMDDSFEGIVQAVKWGRNIYDNIKRFLQFQLTVNAVALASTIVSAVILKEAIFPAVNMLWVNLIMDTLASLALATEPPTEAVLDRRPHDRREYIISRRMTKHIVLQSILQFAIILLVVLTGEYWIPENLPRDVIDTEHKENPYYSSSWHIRAGRGYYITHTGEDYKRFEPEYGPSRHYTLVFNIFVFMSIFNFFNARNLSNKLNVFEGCTRNGYFLSIVFMITVLQIFICEFGGRPLNSSLNGLSGAQWVISILFGALILLWDMAIKVLPVEKIKKILCKGGKKMTDPTAENNSISIIKGDRKKKFRELPNSPSGAKSIGFDNMQYVVTEK